MNSYFISNFQLALLLHLLSLLFSPALSRHTNLTASTSSFQQFHWTQVGSIMPSFVS
jgi:hypothetical protein